MVAVVLATGFEEVEAVTPIDFIRRADINLTVVGVGGTLIRGSHGITIAADISLADYTELPQYVILPGGRPGADNLAASDMLRALLQRVREQDGVLCAICAAPALVLAPWGYLDGKRFTCYPAHASDIAVGTYTTEAVVHDGVLITSRGAGTAARFSAEIIASIKGAAVAKKIMDATLQSTPA